MTRKQLIFAGLVLAASVILTIVFHNAAFLWLNVLDLIILD